LKIDLTPGDKKSRVRNVLTRELWPDSFTDALVCGFCAFFALLLGFGAIFLGGVASLGAISVVIGALFGVAAMGLRRERHWAALLATALTGMTGLWFASMSFAARARELKAKEESPSALAERNSRSIRR
jgi:hypothetical protein